MKFIYSILFSAVISVPAHAETLKLYIQNSTGSTIVAEKADGVKIMIPANGKVDNIPVERNSQVNSYVNGKLACTWIATEDGMPGSWELVGLYYDVYGSVPFCGRIAKDPSNLENRVK